MRSKKAEEYLNRIYKPGNKAMKDKAYNRENTNKAVEIAEQEMMEKATDSFCKTVCGQQNSDCETCTLIKTFKIELS